MLAMCKRDVRRMQARRSPGASETLTKLLMTHGRQVVLHCVSGVELPISRALTLQCLFQGFGSLGLDFTTLVLHL